MLFKVSCAIVYIHASIYIPACSLYIYALILACASLYIDSFLYIISMLLYFACATLYIEISMYLSAYICAYLYIYIQLCFVGMQRELCKHIHRHL
jgi:hypothetical protein